MATAKESDQASAQLREHGFDPSVAPEQALATLKALRGSSGIRDGAIAQALGMIVSAESAAMLGEMEADATGSDRREIRRALYRLRQRGIETPTRPKTAAVAHVVTTESGLTGVLSPADADGARIAWLIKARAGGGMRRLWGLVSESSGLIGATLETVSVKELRADRAEVQRRAGRALIDADPGLVDFILCEAFRRTTEAERGRVGNFLALRTELIAAAPPTELHHPLYVQCAADLATDPSPELMKEPEIAAFQLPAAAVKPFAEEVTSLQQSVIVLNRIQQEERIGTVIERAITELLTGDNAVRLRRHLEDSGYYFARTGKRQQAGWAAAAAARIRDGADLKRVGFFQIFMRAQLGAILAEQQEQSREEPRLIMTPAEAMRAREAAQARMRRR